MGIRINDLAKHKQFLGIAVAAVILTAIFVPFQSANAFTVEVEFPDDTDDSISQSATGQNFEITIDVGVAELISIESITLILDEGTGSPQSSTFDSDGDHISGHATIAQNNQLTISSFSSSSGYGYGFGLITSGNSPPSYSFTTTNDFIGGNELGTSDNTAPTNVVSGLLGPGSITISGALKTATLAEGDHTLDVLIDTGAGGNDEDQLTAPTFEFEVVEEDSVVVEEETVAGGLPAGTTVEIDTTDSDGDPVDIGLTFGEDTTTTGNVVVVVQSTAEFLAANTPEELAAQGFQESTSLTFVTDDDNTEYIPVGFILDIDVSALGLPPGTEVTLNMNYDDSDLDADEELDVRLMHQLDDLSGWEVLTNDDDTINDGDEVDATANIVYGTTDDFSLFAPAIGSSTGGGGGDDDGGSGGGGGGGGGGGTVVINWPPTVTTILSEDYLADHPLERVQVSNSAFITGGGVSVNQANVGQQLSIEGTFANHGGVSQNYAFIVQITDEDGFVTDISWQQGTLAAGSGTDVSTLWTPDAEGEYTVKIFVWNGISATPVPLSEVAENTILVS